MGFVFFFFFVCCLRSSCIVELVFWGELIFAGRFCCYDIFACCTYSAQVVWTGCILFITKEINRKYVNGCTGLHLANFRHVLNIYTLRSTINNTIITYSISFLIVLIRIIEVYIKCFWDFNYLWSKFATVKLYVLKIGYLAADIYVAKLFNWFYLHNLMWLICCFIINIVLFRAQTS